MLMPQPGYREAAIASGIVVFSFLYYISWSYLARWTCKLLLKRDVIFGTSNAAERSTSTTETQNGAAKWTTSEEICVNGHERKGEGSSRCGAETDPYSSSTLYLTDGTLVEISQLIVGQAVSVSAIVAGAIVMYQTYDDVLHSRSWFLAPYIHALVWYFLLDIFAMFWSFHAKHKKLTELRWTRQVGLFLRKKWSFVLHHVLILVVGYPLIVNYQLRRGLGDFFVGMMIMEDISTPFLSAAKILRLLDLKDTNLYRLNGVILLLTFLLARVLYVPFALLIYAAQYHNWDVWLALKSMYPICHFFNAVLVLLQTYWYLALVSIAMRTTRRRGAVTSASSRPRLGTSGDNKCD